MKKAEHAWLLLFLSLLNAICQTNQIFDDRVSNCFLSVSLSDALPLINKYSQVHATLMCVCVYLYVCVCVWYRLRFMQHHIFTLTLQ